MIRDPLALAATIAGLTALAFWLDRRYVWARKVSATLLVIAFGAVLSNLALVPPNSAVYDAVTGPVTSLAIVWLLFAVDLRDLRAAGPRMLGALAIAAGATVVGALAATLAFGDAFGDNAWRLAGVVTGTYIGGSLNFVAVGRELGLPEALFAAATAADNVMTALWMGATLMLPVWLARFYPAAEPVAPRPMEPTGAGGRDPLGSPASEPVLVAAGGSAAGSTPAAVEASASSPRAGAGPGRQAVPSSGPPEDEASGSGHPFFGAASLKLLDLTLLLGLGFALLFAAETVAARIPGIPSVLWLTTFALAVGQLPAVRRLSGAMQLGTLALHFFFAVIGIGSRVAEIARVGPEIFYFTAMVVAVHGVLTYGAARLARLDVSTASVASQAAVGGPSSALALAAAREWRTLVLPGTVAGLLGYAVGNYLGFGVAYLMRGLIGP